MKLLLLLLKSKALITGGTMLLSVFAYAWAFGWQYSVGFVLLIFCHEMGHYLAARQRGLNVGVPTFIPFVGAWIQLKEQPVDAETEAYVGIAGPFIGTLAALACYYWARIENSNLLLAISYSGFFLNLFNLIPLPPFDGGRVTAAISRKMWLVGVPVLLALFLWRPSPILVMMAILAVPQAWRVIKGEDDNTAYYDVSMEKRVEYSLLYLGLLAFLAIMSHDIHRMLVMPR